jgi:spore protease
VLLGHNKQNNTIYWGDYLSSLRTDLALEATSLWQRDNKGTLSDVSAEKRDARGFAVTTVTIESNSAAQELCKPIGKYVTIDIGRYLHRDEDGFKDGALVLAGELRSMLKALSIGEGTVLVVGLGNPVITPDAVGHLTLRNTLVTRHLREQYPDSFASFGDVAAIEPGVLGTTGIESVSIVKSVVQQILPVAVIAVDALASLSLDRLCKTVQISDTGIVPGSGVGNARAELSRATLGVPVIAVGVPTVVDAATLVAQFAGNTEVIANEIQRSNTMMVTPKEIDTYVSDISRLVGYGIDLALHEGLTIEDIDMFIG